MEVNKKWKEDYDTLKVKHETERQLLQKELDLTKERLADSETQVLALGSEVTRLATTLNELYQRHGDSTSTSSLFDVDDYEVFKQQVCKKISYCSDYLSMVHCFKDMMLNAH